jgi:hypothetical protein
VGTRLGVWLDRHGTGPQLLGARAGKIDRSFPVHAGSRRNIRIQLIAGDHADPVMFPPFIVRIRGEAMNLFHGPGSVLVSTVWLEFVWTAVRVKVSAGARFTLDPKVHVFAVAATR